MYLPTYLPAPICLSDSRSRCLPGFLPSAYLHPSSPACPPDLPCLVLAATLSPACLWLMNQTPTSPGSLPPWLPASPVCVLIILSAVRRAASPTCLPTCLPTVCRPASRHTCQPACLPAYITPSCLPVSLAAFYSLELRGLCHKIP